MDALPSFFEERMIELLGSRERLDSLLEAEAERAVRVNPWKTTPAELSNRLGALGIELEAIGWAPGLYRVTDPDPDRSLGAVWEHQAGLFFVQAPESALPVQALDPGPGDRVLDVAAAPGSKTTHIAEAMDNRGLLVANDVNPGRLNNLISNLDQAGVANTVVTQRDSCRLKWPVSFDKVLIDAPCTTLGSMHTSWEPIRRFTKERVKQMVGIQRALLTSAFHAIRDGGRIVYSTCTLEPAENEGVVAWFLEEFPVEIESFKPGIGEPAWTDVAGESYPGAVGAARRVFADQDGSESFFVARFRKMGDASFEDPRVEGGSGGQMEPGPSDAMERLAEAYSLDPGRLGQLSAVESPARWYGSSVPSLEEGLSLAPKRCGLYLAKPEAKGPRLSFAATQLLARGAEDTIELSLKQARAWLSGERIDLGAGHDVPDQWNIVTCLGEPLGCSRPFGTKLPSYVPKRHRLLEEGELAGFLALKG